MSIAIETGEALDAWAKVFELEREHCESDEDLRVRIIEKHRAINKACDPRPDWCKK